MKLRLSKWLVLVLLGFSSSCYACFPAKVSIENRVASSSHIAVGFVTGIYYHQFEQEIETAPKSIQTNEAYTLRVKIIENIKGDFKQEIINPIIVNCGSGSGELKQKVIAFFDGEFWYVEKYDQISYETMVALAHKQ